MANVLTALEEGLVNMKKLQAFDRFNNLRTHLLSLLNNITDYSQKLIISKQGESVFTFSIV